MEGERPGIVEDDYSPFGGHCIQQGLKPFGRGAAMVDAGDDFNVSGLGEGSEFCCDVPGARALDESDGGPKMCPRRGELSLR